VARLTIDGEKMTGAISENNVTIGTLTITLVEHTTTDTSSNANETNSGEQE
jgi:hypothetical protein